MKRKIILIILTGVTIVTILKLFINIKKQEERTKNTGIIYSVDSIPKSLEKVTGLNKRDKDIICATSIALLDKDESGNIVSSLSQNVEVLEEGIEYRFHINPNKYWSNGKKINVDDVINFFKELILKEDKENITTLLNIYGVEEYRAGMGRFEDIVAITKEENVLKIRLNKKNYSFLEELTEPQYRIRQNLSQWRNIEENFTKIIYSGDYSITYINKEMMMLNKNGEEETNITFIKDKNKELAMAYFEVDNRDIILDPPKSQLLRLKKEGRLMTIPQDKGIYVCINSNLELNQRKAMYKKLCEGISDFQQKNPSRIELADGSYFRTKGENLTKLQTRKVKTNQNSENTSIPEIITLLAEDNEDNRDIGKSLIKFFKDKLGIELRCSFVENNQFQDLEMQKRYDLIIISREYDINKLRDFYENILYGFDKEEKEEIKKEIEIIGDYEEIEEKLFDNYRIVPIAFVNKNIAISAKVNNIFLDGNENLNFSTIKK